MLKYNPIINTIHHNEFEIGVLRLDLIHPEISGNKWFKLKYNLEKAKAEKKDTIITFGGAYSNHIAATAFACKLANLKSIGIIRGEETSKTNSTLSVAKQNGMELLFVNRDEYSQKNDFDYLQRLQYMYPNAYIIPEGGDNKLGQKGCEEILTLETNRFTKIFCDCGTGTTFKGIAKSLNENQLLYGVNVLKFDSKSEFENAVMINDYHFGGFAKHTTDLLKFKSWFENIYAIPLDYIYGAKLFYAVFDLINQNKFEGNDSILIIHSGGLQGNEGYEKRYSLNPIRQVTDPVG